MQAYWTCHLYEDAVIYNIIDFNFNSTLSSRSQTKRKEIERQARPKEKEEGKWGRRWLWLWGRLKNQTKYLVIEILDKVQLAKYVTYILQLDYRLVVVNCMCY